MTSLYALPTSSVPIVAMEPVYVTPADVLAAFTAAGVRVYVLREQIWFGLESNHDLDQAYVAFDLLYQLPGQTETLKRYLDR